jgi:hypothetical protein
MQSIAIRMILLIPTILILAACSDDDPVSPTDPLWQEIEFELPTGESRFQAIAFGGGQGLVLGISGSLFKDWPAENIFYRQQEDLSWAPADLGAIPGSMIFLDLALDPDGQPALAGIQDTSPYSVVLDLRGADPTYFIHSTRGMRTIDSDGSFMVAGGWAMGGDLWTSTAPNSWEMDNVTPPLTGTNDSGFRDVDVRDERAVACGFDDGADTLQVILDRTVTTGWSKVPTAGPGTRTFYCIALSEAGTIFVGGIEGAGGPAPKAFLTQRTADGNWSELLLPDPELLHGVNDILIASDGSIYLACMGEGDQTMANLIHATPTGVRTEITPFPGGLLQLAEAGNGDIYAVGFRRDEETGSETAVMLRRSP